jgi:hypothetical protein
VLVRTNEPQAAAAARIGAGRAVRKRAELIGRLRSCFARTGTWQQAGKYVSALVSDMPKRNGWTIAQHAGDRTPDRTQRLLNRASWDTLAVMSEVRRVRGSRPGRGGGARPAAGRAGDRCDRRDRPAEDRCVMPISALGALCRARGYAASGVVGAGLPCAGLRCGGIISGFWRGDLRARCLVEVSHRPDRRTSWTFVVVR